MSGDASLDGGAAFIERACEALQAARRRLDWLSLALEPRLYGHREFNERLRAFLLRHHRVRVRLLLIEPMRVLQQAGQGIDFIRSMSSRVEIRAASPELTVAHEEWMILDQMRWLQTAAPPARGGFDETRPTEVRPRQRLFDQWWEVSPPASALRRLHL